MADGRMKKQIDDIQAEEAEAMAEDNPAVYVHYFRKPFRYGDREYTELTFDFSRLKGSDSVFIQSELRRKGIAAIIPATTPEYLTIMCSMACTERETNGNRPITEKAIEEMPILDFNRITAAGRRFLLSAGW